MKMVKYTIFVVLMLLSLTTVRADYPERSDMARDRGERLTVKEWKCTPDGKSRWIDHVEVYNELGQLIEEREYSDYGRNLAWRAEYTYNEQGALVQEILYNERNKVSKVRKFEYDSDGRCVRRLNYNANGTLNSYREFEFIYE